MDPLNPPDTQTKNVNKRTAREEALESVCKQGGGAVPSVYITTEESLEPHQPSHEPPL